MKRKDIKLIIYCPAITHSAVKAAADASDLGMDFTVEAREHVVYRWAQARWLAPIGSLEYARKRDGEYVSLKKELVRIIAEVMDLPTTQPRSRA